MEAIMTAENHLVSATGYVGRERELEVLRSILEQSVHCRGGIVMLAGAPGVCKTRTAQELASYAEKLLAKVLWGSCYEEEGAPSYWPWVQPIRSYIEQTSQEQLLREMGLGAAALGEVFSEIRQEFPDLAPLTELEPEQARFRLFESITTFLKNSARSQPLLLVLDDLHWSDRSSLLLLEFIAHRIHSLPL
jgi:predicted ATPase